MKVTTNPPPSDLTLKPGDLHLWFTSLKCTSTPLEQLKQLLSPDELARSQRFKAREAQEHFIAGRGILKQILSRYLHLPANQIQLTYESLGKPKLDESLQHIYPNLAFNLSHSHGVALYGISATSFLGVDLEHRARELSFDEIAQRFFSPAEVQEIQQAQGENKKICFYNIWTKKEALLKALGTGLHSPLSQFTVRGWPQEKIDELTHLSFDPNAQKWRVFSLDYDPQFSVSIAMNQKPQTLYFWDWDGFKK